MPCRLSLAALLLALLAPALPAQEEFASREGVLVLRNGHVVQGQITRLGDRYSVAVGNGGEVRFPLEDVEFQCGTLDEAYLRKRDLLDSSSIRQRLDLAEWCLRHELPHRAADQLLAATTINPFDVRARALRRRLLQMCDAREIADHTGEGAASTTDWQALERVLETIPAPAIEKFTASIQPLLLNRCGASACHSGQAGGDFRLMRPLKDKTLPRRLTQRNLYAALQMIDEQDPENSPLLTVPQGPHGGEQQGMFDGRRELQWVELREWVRMAARPVDPATGLAATDQSGADSPEAALPAGNTNTAFRPPTAAAANNEIHRSVFESPHRPATPMQAPSPRDPFDPDVFNRRYFPEKFTPSTANAPKEPASRN